MGNAKINDQKRNQMRDIVTAVLKSGFRQVKDVAKLMNVSTGTVRRWAAGESMGTNSQRLQLSALVQRQAHGLPDPKPVAVSDAKLEQLRAKAVAALPKRITCPHCGRSRPGSKFGIRLMNRSGVEKGAVPIFRSQPRCNSCR